MGEEVLLCHTFMEKQVECPNCPLLVPAENQKNNLYNKSY